MERSSNRLVLGRVVEMFCEGGSCIQDVLIGILLLRRWGVFLGIVEGLVFPVLNHQEELEDIFCEPIVPPVNACALVCRFGDCFVDDTISDTCHWPSTYSWS